MKKLLKGTEAIGEAAIIAGCRFYAGYPITPQSELTEYMAYRLPQVGGVFVQAESEVAAINMLYGASAAGARVMTSTSSPGFSLMQEGISYSAGAELPMVLVDCVRGGPGLGGIQPAQSDYLQITKGGGHGDYKLVALAPSSIQELIDLTIEAFEIADRYRNPVVIMADGMLAQMMEPGEFPENHQPKVPEKPWALTGAKGRKKNVILCFDLTPEGLEEINKKLKAKYDEIRKREKRFEKEAIDDAEIVLVACGSCARVAKSAAKLARKKGIKVGLFRPITIWPFPYEEIAEVAERPVKFMVVEMAIEQMYEDVKLAVGGRRPIKSYWRTGGVVPTPEELADKIEEYAREG